MFFNQVALVNGENIQALLTIDSAAGKAGSGKTASNFGDAHDGGWGFCSREKEKSQSKKGQRVAKV
ncbi:hypothetical protein CMQ_4337 [Grosmannia clavigera kw1407]|uniref:Uncharacterized protein n=1 Tax=Grosmannia clavigera (strain kw1407 / UAMH 11150) TaxID=655863 RepID=F0XTT3_GROCL|nr:uncharacterized protein CMQ_4337 [Grosmannia clavigera kw1407]EFW98485.1 hypothetical protein CMQ_4337 [Grosmannia clavigera kw1407]